jgi:hypothetical protein
MYSKGVYYVYQQLLQMVPVHVHARHACLGVAHAIGFYHAKSLVLGSYCTVLEAVMGQVSCKGWPACGRLVSLHTELQQPCSPAVCWQPTACAVQEPGVSAAAVWAALLMSQLSRIKKRE